MADPFIARNTQTIQSAADTLPILTEYGYDFDKQQFLYDENGNIVTVTEDEALKVWIYKAILTERYRYLAYHDEYGITIEPYQGTMPNNVYTADRIRQNIREGLSINPYIAKINSITIEKREKDELIVSVDVTSIYSDDSLVVTAGRSL